MITREKPHFPGWDKRPLLTMAYVEERSRWIADYPGKMAEFWRDVLEPSWADRIAEPVVAVVPVDAELKTQSMVMVGFGTLAEISDALLHQLFPSLAGLVDGLVLMSGRGMGDARPQMDDFAFHRQAVGCAGRTITFHDHIIIGSHNYFSFHDNNWPKSLRKKLHLRRAPSPQLRMVRAPRSNIQEPLFPLPNTDLIAA